MSYLRHNRVHQVTPREITATFRFANHRPNQQRELRVRRTAAAIAARALATAIAAAALLAATSGCSHAPAPGPAWPNSANPSKAAAPVPLRLGFVTEITQAPALVALQEGMFASNLRGASIVLRPVPFRTDAAEATALENGQLDAVYADADSIVADLANPGGVQISVVSGAAAGKAGPVNLVVTRAFLSAHSAGVQGLVRAQVQANDLMHRDLLGSTAAYAAEITALTGQRFPASAVASAFTQATFTDDPEAATLTASVPPVQRATVSPALSTLYDLAPLDLFLRMAGEHPVTAYPAPPMH